MSLDLPEWVSDLPGFDPAKRWWPIVCTGDRRHSPELLAIAYHGHPHTDWHAAGPYLSTARRVDAQGNPNGPAHPDLGVREAGSVTLGPCPRCSHTERVPLVRWAEKVTTLAERDPGTDGVPYWFDVTR